MCYFLDCTRAGYTDRHLMTWFVIMTLGFLNSICARLAATPEGESILNACVRYGDWSGHGHVCQPGGLLEPSWTVVLVGVFLCFSAALMDQGTIRLTDEETPDADKIGKKPPRSRRQKCRQQEPLVQEVNLILAAAVKLKALVRKQMHGMAFVLGRQDEEEKEIDGSSLDLADNFEKSLTKIFGALEFEHILAKEETSHSETIQVLELCAPDALMREQANLRLRMSGCPNSNAWESNVKRYDQYKESANKWTTLTESVDIMKEYDFCNYLQGYSKKKIVRSSTGTVDERHSRDCGCRGHVVLGSFLGLLGFYLFSFMAPQGDSYAWVYYWVDRIAFVDVRCQETNTTSAASPWCDATDYLLMSRTTLWVSHGDMLDVQSNELAVITSAALKALILALLSSLLAITVAKTVAGLQQATHPMQILDAILSWWARADHMSTSHLHVWKLARDSILHNDVKNILDRYENVVLAYLVVSFWLLTDSTVQVAIFNNAPNVMAGYVLVIMCGCMFLCVYQALRVHYAQLQHVSTLRRLKESTYAYGARPDLEHQRRLIDEMIHRMSSGGDYQTRLLYMPLNPTFQKGVLAYFLTAFSSIAVRLIVDAVSSPRPLGAFEVLANATAKN
ncbi:unnamed protein product [Symbiodinium pilosum]|uniref:Uncharacterized protein n=1 Tax=Symbiodinium pilosum TaxID=2952 RepID=A0A812NBE0_SYMPI|nr:unnamed protein product [Symbiodinium pilosum]